MYSKLRNDITENMKSKNVTVVHILRYLDSAIQSHSLKINKPIDNDMVISILKSELKKVNEEIENSIKYDRIAITTVKKFEKDVIEKYIPAMLTEEQIRSEISNLINANENFSSIMKSLKSKFGILVDMGLASKIAKELTSGK